MAYDSAVITFTTKTDKVDLVQAAHMNAVQSELVTIETILGANVKGDRTDLKTRLNNALDADGSILSGTAFTSPALTSQLFFRTDLGLLYLFNSAWGLVGASLSNVLFQYSAHTTATGANVGEYAGTDQTPQNQTGNYRFLQGRFGADTYGTVWTTKWMKVNGISTITVYGEIWVDDTTASSQATLKVDVGGANGSVAGTAQQTTPEWKYLTVDVSGLTNGTTYDVTVQLKNAVDSHQAFLGNMIAFGS